MQVAKIHTVAQTLSENICKVIVGKKDVIDQVLTALFAGGHILLEDMPGTGKTTLAKSIARSVDCSCTRVQFTPDFLPSDLTGINYYNQKQGEFVFRQGPVFTNVLLADEINRATPRTQSSLLECMEEGQITVDSVTYPLEQPFFVIATQNPVEIQGTFPLPEAQMDRFMMRLSLGYPSKEFEIEMLGRFSSASPIDSLESVITKQQLIEAQKAVRQITLSKDLLGYIVELVEASRNHPQVRMGVSPRGALALMHASQAKAALSGRDFVTPDDVKSVAVDVMAHRLLCRNTAAARETSGGRMIVEELLSSVPVPTEA